MPRATFRQISLRPGRYHLGGGLYRDLTASDLAAYVKGTRAVLSAGHQIPMLFEHAAAGSADGAPVQLSIAAPAKNREQRRQQLADQVKHGAGWLRGIEQTKGGDLAFTVEANDPDAIKGLRNGTIKFTSPELREGWTDGKGATFNKIVSHVALTHKPRNPDQSALAEVVAGQPAPALQFSLADWQQFSDDDDEDEEKKPPEAKDDDDAAPKNPDAPPDDTQENQAAIAQFQALLEHLAADGLDLTADTTPETLIRDLLIAYKTKAALKDIDDEDDDDDDDEEKENDDAPGNPNAYEEKPMVQFSLGDVGTDAVPKLLGLVMQGRHDQVIAAADAAQREGQFPPALTKRLKDEAGLMQFSADAEEGTVYTVSEVVQLLRETLPAGAYTHWTSDQFSLAQVNLPPSQLTALGEGQEMTREQAKALVDEQSKHIPGIARCK